MIGNTDFYQSVELSDRLAVNGARPVVYIKREDQNDGYTFKSRAIQSELERLSGVESPVVLAAITDGNLGYAGALLCSAYTDRKFASIVDKGMPERTKRLLRRSGSYVVETDHNDHQMSSSEVVELVRHRVPAGTRVVPVGNIDADGSGYKTLAKELYNDGVRRDWTVCLPVGGGELLYNLVAGFEEIGEVPRFLAGTTSRNVFGEKKPGEFSGDDKLAAPFALLHDAVVEKIKRYGIPIVTPTYGQREEEFLYMKSRGIRTSRTSATALAAARQFKFSDGQNVAFINTGYEPEETQSFARNLVRYAAGLLAVSMLVPIDVHNNFTTNKMIEIHRTTAEYMRNWDKSEILLKPERAMIKAFAEYTGGSEEKTVGILDRQILNNDAIERDIYKNNPSVRKLVNDYGEFKRITRALQGSSEEDGRFITGRVSEALRIRVEPSADKGISNSFIMDYLDRDPYLNNKIAFALSRTGGATDGKFIRIVSDLHWPGYGNIESAICRTTPSCMETRKEFEQWTQTQKKNWDRTSDR